MPTGTKRRALRIEDDLWAAAQAEATRRGESVSEAVRRFLRDDYVKGEK